MKFDMSVFFENLSKKFKSREHLTRITGTLHEELCTIMISHTVILRMRSVSEKPWREFKIYSLCSITLFRKSCSLWDNVEQYGRARQATDYIVVRCMPFSCWISKATGMHSECVITLAFPLQQWLRERTAILRYTYLACLVTAQSVQANSTIMSQICNTVSFDIPSSWLITALDVYSKLPRQPKYEYFSLYEQRPVETMRKISL